MRQFTFDLSAASLSTDTNPFVSSSSTSSPTSPASSSSPSSSPSSNPDSGSTSSTVGPSPQKIADYEKAHGIIMGTTVVLLFPFGATYMRLGGNASLHALIQIFSLVALFCGFGLGVKLATMTDYVRLPPFPPSAPPPKPPSLPSPNPSNKPHLTPPTALQIHRRRTHNLRHCNNHSLHSATLPRISPPLPIPEIWRAAHPRLAPAHLVRTLNHDPRCD